jgi:hypothetical protein
LWKPSERQASEGQRGKRRAGAADEVLSVRRHGYASRPAVLLAVALALFCAACAGHRREKALLFSPAVRERLDQEYDGLGTRLAGLLEIQRNRRWEELNSDLLAPLDSGSDPRGFLADYPSWYASKLVDLSLDAARVGRGGDDGQTVMILGCGKYKDYAVPQYLTTAIVAVRREGGWRFYPPSLYIPIDGSPDRCKP